MKKGRFLWSAYRITEKQKAGKARNIKEKQLKNSRNTVSKQLVEHQSLASVNKEIIGIIRFSIFRDNYIRFTTPQDLCSGEFLYKKRNKYDILYLNRSK